MAKTIGKHWPRSAPRGDYTTFCGYCGVAYRRSELYRDEAGILVCPREGQGLDVIAAERANQEMARDLWVMTEHDGPEDPLSTDVAPDLAAMLGNPPSGGH